MEVAGLAAARRWLLPRRTPLRTADALHLAGAAAVDADFVTLDASLEEAATALGVATLRDWP
jgi:predicted nucleic acid-binding protein